MRLALIAAAVVACAAACALATSRASAAPESCTVTAATIPLGSFDVFVAPTSVAAKIQGTCKKGSGTLPNLLVTAGSGAHSQASGNRAMACTTCTGVFTSDLLQYQLYTDAALTTIWNTSGVSIGNPCPCSGNTSAAWFTMVYGEIFTAVAGGINDSSVGSYSDTVVVTVNY